MNQYRVFGAVSLCLLASFLWISGCGPQTAPSWSVPHSTTKVHDATSSVTVNIDPGSSGRGTGAFGANPLTIQPGTIVTWVNNDSTPHSATSDTGEWDSGIIPPGQSYSYNFSRTGTYAYHCSVSGEQSMSGVIQVGGSQHQDPNPYPTSPNPYPTDLQPSQPQEQQKPKPKPYPTKPYPKPYPKPTQTNPSPWPTPTPRPTLYRPGT